MNDKEQGDTTKINMEEEAKRRPRMSLNENIQYNGRCPSDQCMLVHSWKFQLWYRSLGQKFTSICEDNTNNLGIIWKKLIKII